MPTRTSIALASLVLLGLLLSSCTLVPAPATPAPSVTVTAAPPTSTAIVVLPTAAASVTAAPVTPSPAGTVPATSVPAASPTAAAVASPTRAVTPSAGTPVAGASPTAPANCVALDSQFQATQARAQGIKEVFPYAPTVNCPLKPSYRVNGALQEFRQATTGPNQFPKVSYMLWREDTKAIYVLVKNEQSSGISKAYVYQDTWTETEPRVPAACAAIIPPQDVPPATDPGRAIQVPVRGFGKIWCNENWQQAIGYGNGREVGGTMVIQDTAGGLYLGLLPTGGRETTSYFLIDTDRGGALAP